MKVLVRGYFYKIGLKELSVFYPAVQSVQQDIYGFRLAYGLQKKQKFCKKGIAILKSV